MNVDKIKEAAKLFIGEHDFRNLCKIDVLQTTNFIRTIHFINIDEINPGVQYQDSRMKQYVATISGNAFLWHQIRNIMAVLFLIGKGQEDTSIVTDLLDIQKYSRKPNYEMASEFPLVLYDCQYDQLDFQYEKD
ncbi:tRNA pseudouridine synthase a family protein, putative, partial [Ichthyophthirius multifiliis]